VPNDIRLPELKVGVIINTSSGSCDLESEQKMLSVLTEAGLVEPKVWCGEAKEMERFFAEAAGQKLELLIVLGGDGTIRTAAEACAEKGSYLIPLPGGTMNMLPRALYGNVSWEEAFKNTISGPSAKRLSGGRVANKQFFVAAIVGAPALWTQARESVREREAEAVIVICPLVSEEMSDSEQALEAAVIDVENAAEVIRLATAATFGKWRDDRKVHLAKTKRVAVQSNKEMSATLDGESVNLGMRAEIDFVPRALTVLVPAK